MKMFADRKPEKPWFLNKMYFLFFFLSSAHRWDAILLLLTLIVGGKIDNTTQNLEKVSMFAQ